MYILFIISFLMMIISMLFILFFAGYFIDTQHKYECIINWTAVIILLLSSMISNILYYEIF